MPACEWISPIKAARELLKVTVNLRGGKAMAMSKKHYEQLARVIGKNWGKTIGKDSTILSDMCDILQADNPNFRRNRFIVASAEAHAEKYRGQ